MFFLSLFRCAPAPNQQSSIVSNDGGALVTQTLRSAQVSNLRSARVSDPAETADRRSPAMREPSGQPSAHAISGVLPNGPINVGDNRRAERHEASLQS